MLQNEYKRSFHTFAFVLFEQLFNQSTISMWKEEDNSLKKTFKFKDFSEAFAFMTRVAFLAERMNHHPEWKNIYNTVEISLSTHDAGNTVTEKDRKLADAIDKLTANNK